MRLAVIPARGGSKRIPRKNVRRFAGKPMILYAIEAARKSRLFDRIVVSTDDEEIAAVARDGGAETPFVRPAELADDFTPTVPVIAHAIRACAGAGVEPGLVCCIYPAVPLIDSADLAAACALAETDGPPYVFPVAAFPSPIQRALRRGPGGAVSPYFEGDPNARTQDLEPAFYDAGQFYWGPRDAWLDGANVHRNGRAIIIPEWRAVDIDTADDWLRAEALYHAIAADGRAQGSRS